MSGAKSDLMLHEGVISGHPQSDSIAIGGGRIMACGRYDDLKTMVGPNTHLIRLNGRTVLPGFIDSHLHFLEGAAISAGIQLSRARSVRELLLELRQASARTAPGNWLRAFGCDEALLQERRGPTRQELDGVVTKQPLRLRHQTLHASWLNSRAINLLGLEKPGFVAPPGARLERDQNDRLNGLVVGMEEWLTERLPPITMANLEARARNFSRELASAGVTSFTDATVRNSLEHVTVFARLVGCGAIAQHAAVMLGEDHVDDYGEAHRIGREYGLAIAGIKFRGRGAYDAMDLFPRVERALGTGLGCAFHATEIEETEAAISALESARVRLGREALTNATCRIEHGGVIAPDQVERLAALNAWVVTNPGFVFYRGEKYLSEPGLMPHTYRCQSLMRAGVRVAAGTDAPVTPSKPLIAIAAAATRRTRDGRDLAPEERVAMPQAWQLFTIAGAELAGWSTGAIDVGRAADLIVMPRDPMQATATELASMPIDLTIVGGHVVFERGRPATFTGIPETI